MSSARMMTTLGFSFTWQNAVVECIAHMQNREAIVVLYIVVVLFNNSNSPFTEGSP
jgi:hypothetical protein